MFGFLGPEVMHFVDMREALITFWSKGKKTLGANIKVRFALPGTKAKSLDLTLRIVTSRPSGAAQKGYINVGIAHLPEEKLADIEELLRAYGTRPDLGTMGRRSQRLPNSLKVMGRELPGFVAVTVDISQHGVRINCQGILKVGLVVNLTLESDMASFENLQMRARTIWSWENKDGKGYLAGLEFIDLTPAQQDNLEQYCKSLAGRLRGNVMHRQIADGALVARPEVKEYDVLPAAPSKGQPPPPPTSPQKGPPPPPAWPGSPPPPPPPPR
ncbi:PilZ domain-containing protein [bacterium]|nr:PilZ domain-containing protein [bacterium]